MPSYNHAEFIIDSIESVLNQDFDDFELLISDDGSTDGTAEIAFSVKDPRLSVFTNSTNRGAAVVHNDLISKSTGRYIALINSDDVWVNNKLSKQVEFLDDHAKVGACFSRANFIDRKGVNIDKEKLSFGNVFDVDNRSSGAWLRHFFFKSNCICHPTILARRDVYEKIGKYDNRLRQLPDFDMWIRLVKASSLYILTDKLIQFRILENAVSSPIDDNVRRIYNEHWFIARRFFDQVSDDMLLEGFSDLLIRTDLPSQEHIDIETAFLFFQKIPGIGPMYATVGLTMLHDFLGSEAHKEILRSDYDFDERSLHKKAVEANAFFTARPESDIDVIRQELDNTRLQLTEITRSNSWRVTAPVRSFRRFLGR